MRETFMVLACVAIAGCGGGGGGGGASGGSGSGSGSGGSSGPDFDSAAQLQPGQAISAQFTADGTAVQARFVSPGVLGPVSDPEAAQLVALDTNGDGTADAVRLTTGGEAVAVTLQGTTPQSSVGGRVIVTDDGQAAFIVRNNPDMEYAVYGGWTDVTAGTNTAAVGNKFNFGAFGAPTPAASIPSGPARYVGKSVGVASDGNSTALTASDVTINTTDFTNVQVTSQNTVGSVIASQGTSSLDPSSLDFTANGTVTGNGFEATGGNMRADGNFYGPAANEAAGTFNGTVGGVNYGGAFGASQTNP